MVSSRWIFGKIANFQSTISLERNIRLERLTPLSKRNNKIFKMAILVFRVLSGKWHFFFENWRKNGPFFGTFWKIVKFGKTVPDMYSNIYELIKVDHMCYQAVKTASKSAIWFMS